MICSKFVLWRGFLVQSLGQRCKKYSNIHTLTSCMLSEYMYVLRWDGQQAHKIIDVLIWEYLRYWPKSYNQSKVKSIHFWHTIKLYFRYRFTQLYRTTEHPNFNLRALLVCSFKKPLISRTSLKSNLKHISTSILRKEWRHLK